MNMMKVSAYLVALIISLGVAEYIAIRFREKYLNKEEEN